MITRSLGGAILAVLVIVTILAWSGRINTGLLALPLAVAIPVLIGLLVNRWFIGAICALVVTVIVMILVGYWLASGMATPDVSLAGGGFMQIVLFAGLPAAVLWLLGTALHRLAQRWARTEGAIS